jgi:endonuclease/exonuclease/phosphatase family metal-dependent hydrolase
MTFRAALFLLLAVPFSMAAAEPTRLPQLDRAKGQVRVVTYNILGGRNPDNAHDLKRLADILGLLNPDLVALQEVDVKTRRFRGRDLPKELGEATGLQAFFGAAMPFQGGEYGVAILSRLPVESHTAHLLPARPGNEPRAALETICRLGEAADAPKLRFIATHLDATEGEAERLAQTAKLLELFPTPAVAPVSLLAGDFNAELSSAALTGLQAKWTVSWPEGKAAKTFPAIQPKIGIDHVFLPKDGPWKVLRIVSGTEIFPGDAGWKERLEKASDHLPVVVELELGGGK